MALELKFYKTDNTPWGFRLTGGADCEIPLTVIKVTQDSIAEEAGLQVADVVVRINDETTAALTHMEAHDVIAKAGNCFIMTVRRDYYTSESINDDEICDILESCLQNGNCSDSETNNLSSRDVSRTEDIRLQTGNSEDLEEPFAVSIPSKTEVLPEQTNLGVNCNQSLNSTTVQVNGMKDGTVGHDNKQWSTFLQKPARPIPVPKPKDDDIPKAPPYKPIIKRQKKIDIEIPNGVIEPSKPTEDTTTTHPCEVVPESEEEEIIAEEDEEIDPDSLNADLTQNEISERVNSCGENSEENSECGEEIIEEPEEEPEEEPRPLTLEEQLALVQQQLKALAQLPSEVQDSLEAVTKQLAQIVRSHREIDDEEETRSGITQNDISQQVTCGDDEEVASEYSERELNSEYARSQTSESSEYNEDEDCQVKSYVSVIDNGAPNEEDEEELEPEIDPEVQRLEEEKLLQQERKNLQAEESHQRRLEQRPTYPLAPLQRPIILPGGRRWSQPNDALPVPKKAKMTDEKICETLNIYAEVISGRTKGINFLKYTPPAKNLDYLQNSEVFRLIHEAEPADKGIAARQEKVISEQDYYDGHT